MSVIVYKEGRIYSDFMMVGDSVAFEDTRFEQDKSYVCPETGAAFVHCGKAFNETTKKEIAKLFYILASTSHWFDSIKKTKSFTKEQTKANREKVNNLIKATEKGLINVEGFTIGGYKGYVFLLKEGETSEDKNSVTALETDMFYSNGSDALTMQMLLQSGVNIAEAYQLISEESEYVTKSFRTIELNTYKEIK